MDDEIKKSMEVNLKLYVAYLTKEITECEKQNAQAEETGEECVDMIYLVRLHDTRRHIYKAVELLGVF